MEQMMILSTISSISILRLCYSLRESFLTTLTRAAMPKLSPNNKKLADEKRVTFARNLREARIEAGYTQEDVVLKTGLTQVFISKLENADVGVSLTNACILAEAVGKPLCTLLKNTLEK